MPSHPAEFRYPTFALVMTQEMYPSGAIGHHRTVKGVRRRRTRPSARDLYLQDDPKTMVVDSINPYWKMPNYHSRGTQHSHVVDTHRPNLAPSRKLEKPQHLSGDSENNFKHPHELGHNLKRLTRPNSKVSGVILMFKRTICPRLRPRRMHA
ncbi:hypothetical protein BD410DRAFT_782254 [Rickenella mellea]|uniref:Uncharacterized protein n=1 Tax=Rickenella mellea TaxID=50990 RepID=A0A4Y7QMI9_9AGAM|nr:hypothetical protein BD410DRAFT_782254 [Rickenella mellea]